MNLDDYISDNKLSIIVKANSSQNIVTGYDENRKAVKVSIKEPAENNKANIEIIKYFKKLTKKDVKIISGFTSKKKLLKFID